MKRKKDKKSRSERGQPSQGYRPTTPLDWKEELINLKSEGSNYNPPPPKTDAERIIFIQRMPFRIIKGWRFQLSVGLGQYQLSISLYPRGRSSIEDDWGFLGSALAVLGVPENHEPFGIRDGKIMGGWPDPGAVHHFWWPISN